MNLQAQQSQLLAALFDSWPSVQTNQVLALQQTWPTDQYLRGLQAYRSNASITAQNSLRAVYPHVARLMGDAQFDGLATHFWRTQAPTRGDLAQWGDGLADFLRGIPALMQQEAHLPDLAQLEWALHAGKTAPNPPTDEPVPLIVVDSHFPIVDLIHGKEWAAISDQNGQRALVYRQGFKTNCISISKDLAL